MTVTVQCRTLFDITATGVRNHTSTARRPFQDQAGQQVDTDQQWVRSRNQQRNWDTINQILALRTLPERVTVPQVTFSADQKQWIFEFDIPDLSAVTEGTDLFGLLRRDAEAVPMIIGLSETTHLPATLHTMGDDVNVWFAIKA